MSYHILLTGHEGYVGQHLQKALLEREVIVGTFEGDLLDIEWEKKQKQFDMVVHLAGLAGVRRSFREPEEYYKNNVELSRRIFKYCERTRTEVVYASSVPSYLVFVELNSNSYTFPAVNTSFTLLNLAFTYLFSEPVYLNINFCS